MEKEAGPYTIKDIEALPDGERAELVNGFLYMMAAPGRTHQSIVGFLYRKIADYIERNHGSCEVYFAPFAVYIKEDIKNYVEPDISVICDTDKLDEDGCHGAPDWVIEVASSNAKNDYTWKRELYQEAGVREYWIVDIQKGVAYVYDFENGRSLASVYSLKDRVSSKVMEGLEIDFSESDMVK